VYSVCLQKCLEHLFQRVNHLVLPSCVVIASRLLCQLQRAVLLSLPDLTLFCCLLHQLALYTLCQYGTPSQVDAHLNSSAKLLQTSLVIVIFATSQDLSRFVCKYRHFTSHSSSNRSSALNYQTTLLLPRAVPRHLACSSAAR
jgi:hypothetical protein